MKNFEVSEELIRETYLRPPNVEQIKNLIEDLRVSTMQFERFYSIPKDVVRHVLQNRRSLPVKFWPLVYEKFTPQYGVSYKEINMIIFKKAIRTNKRTPNICESPDIDTHGRLTLI